jgi:hypothetical protein
MTSLSDSCGGSAGPRGSRAREMVRCCRLMRACAVRMERAARSGWGKTASNGKDRAGRASPGVPDGPAGRQSWQVGWGVGQMPSRANARERSHPAQRSPAAMLRCPARRSRLIARLRRVAITWGPWPLRT